MNRRLFVAASLAGACRSRRDNPQSGWPRHWDRVLIEKAVSGGDQRFDPAQSMVRAILGPEYRYHTRLRERLAHPTRESLEYALYLLEEGSAARISRALRILDRVLALQVTAPDSRWYGLWGWYLEEPPERMAPADWNWADFNGSLLLLIEFRHGAKLGAGLRARLRAAILHAAHCIRSRNVSPSYTNIAIMGSFVTLAAAELLEEPELAAYARGRVRRLCEEIDRTGSFAEYNSPAYGRVSMTSLTRIRMYVRDADGRRRATVLERRLWEHLGAHWDAARQQFAGPMSRCYANDTGYPLWLEKALAGRLRLASPENRSGEEGETAIHDYRCPEELVSRFLWPRSGAEHRELFLPEPPTSGVTYFSRGFSLGSADRSDFWGQRRPLLAYFGDAARPARTVELRVIKDGYDFSSAVFHSVQKQGRVLGLIAFRNPGGDRHISLDPIRGGQFACGRLFAELDIQGLEAGFHHSLEGDTLSLDSSLIRLRCHLIAARFGAHSPAWSASLAGESLTATFDFQPAAAGRIVRWAQVPAAFAALALELADAGAPLGPDRPAARLSGHSVEISWGDLALRGLVSVATAEEHDRAFAATIGGRPVPLVRLSEEKLAARHPPAAFPA